MDDFWRANTAALGLDDVRYAPETDPERRRKLVTEMDVLVARDIFGLSLTDMAYLLDPADVLGPDCGFETFGALKRADVRTYGRFETRDAILACWSELRVEAPAPNRVPAPARRLPLVMADLRDGAWQRPQGRVDLLADVQLAALLKAIPEPIGIDVALRAAFYSFEPHRLTKHLDGAERLEWIRLVGQEAIPREGVLSLGLGGAAGLGLAINRLTALGSLRASMAEQTWAAGAGLDGYYTDSWPQRAVFALQAAVRLAAQGIQMQADEVEMLNAFAA